MQEFMVISKALADQNRVRILLALREHELCVCQLTALLGLAPSTVSKHLSLLKHAGLVTNRKVGLLVYCALPEHPDKEVAGALQWLNTALSDNKMIQTDRAKVEEIMAEDIAEICRNARCRCRTDK